MKAFWITIGAFIVAALAVTVGLLVHSNCTNKSLPDMFKGEQVEQTETEVENDTVVDDTAAVILY